MWQPRTYVLRVYRQGPKRLVGLIENPSNGTKQTFSTMEQLWGLLRTPSTTSGRQSKVKQEAPRRTGELSRTPPKKS